MAQRKNTKTEALNASTAIEVVSQSDIPIAEVVLTPEQEKELADCAERLVALGRRTTAQTYEYGEQLSKAQALLPPKKFGQWLDAHCGIKTKTAKNYTRVFHELAAYRVRLEKAAAVPAAMFALLGATDDAIENVLAVYEDGKRPTVAEVKEMVGGAGKVETPEVNVLDMPGRAGCLKVGQARMRANIDAFYDLLAKVFPYVKEAAEKIAAGQRVGKAELGVMIELESRHAHDLFQLTLAPFVEGYDLRSAWRPTSLDKATAWGKVQKVLLRLGNDDDWPTRGEFKTWIVEEVYPALKFAVLGEALPSNALSTGPAEAAVTPDDVAGEIDNLETSLVPMDAPSLQPDNVVALAPRQKVKQKNATATDA